jgi:hypothetical protein
MLELRRFICEPKITKARRQTASPESLRKSPRSFHHELPSGIKKTSIDTTNPSRSSPVEA